MNSLIVEMQSLQKNQALGFTTPHQNYRHDFLVFQNISGEKNTLGGKTIFSKAFMSLSGLVWSHHFSISLKIHILP